MTRNNFDAVCIAVLIGLTVAAAINEAGSQRNAQTFIAMEALGQ